MRHQVRAYHSATKSISLADLQSIWINDYVLTRAIQRFKRIFSRSCKRHGSNTPGPLEAQRRLAKRNMGVLSPSSSFPPPGDFGALFGAGYQPELQWNWEPPNPTTRLSQPIRMSNLSLIASNCRWLTANFSFGSLVASTTSTASSEPRNS